LAAWLEDLAREALLRAEDLRGADDELTRLFVGQRERDLDRRVARADDHDVLVRRYSSGSTRR
jgi:hypothetical protein